MAHLQNVQTAGLLRCVVAFSLAAALIGCAPQAAKQPAKTQEAVGEGTPPAAEPSPTRPVTHRQWVEDLRHGRTPDGCPPQCLHGLRRVEERHGRFLFDKQGWIQGVDLAGERVSVDDQDVAALVGIPGLRQVLLAGGITSQSIEYLTAHATLAELMLQDAQITDGDLARLAEFPALESLTLRRCAALTDEGLAVLAQAPKLARLQLLDCNFTDRAVELLASSKRLRLLDLRGCDQITSAGLARLKTLPQLVAVRVSGQQVTDDTLRAFAELKKLRSLTLDDAAISNDGLAALAALDLEELNLSRCLNVTDAGLAVLTRWAHLQSLTLRDLAVTDAALAHVAGHRRLATLVLRELLIGNAGIAHLAALTTVRRLELRQTLVSDAGLGGVARWTGLESLDLAECRVSDAGVAKLAALQSLKALDLSACAGVTDASVALLARLTTLETLKVSRTGISREGAQRLRDALPNCTIVADGV